MFKLPKYWQLKFEPPQRENQFNNYMLNHDVNAIWISGILGTIIYFAFVVMDYYLHHHLVAQMAIIRLCFAIPFFFAGLLIATLKPNLIKVGRVQKVVVAIVFIVQLSQFSLATLPQIHPYYLLVTTSLMTVIINMMLNIRFVYLLVLNFSFFVVFQFLIVFFYDMPEELELFQYLTYASILIFSLASAYIKEHNLRLMFDEVLKNKYQNNELRVLNNQLASQQTDLEQFAFASSHDLKTPLRVIFGLTRLIERDTKTRLSKQSKSDFKDLKSEVENMDNVLKGLHNYSRIGIESTKKTSIDVVSILDNIDFQIQHTALENNQLVTLNYPSYIPNILSSHLDVLQLFKNLIDNAVKHCQVSHCIVNIDYQLMDNDYLQFSLADNGLGISGEYLDKIFRLFQTLEPKKGSNFGVGLAIVKKIITINGGTIYYDESYTEGAKFVFTLPLVIEV